MLFSEKTASLTFIKPRPILHRQAPQIPWDFSLLKAQYISILLIGLVVLCPFQCILGGCLAGDTVQVLSCCNCELPASDTGGSVPSAPEDCNCGDCFCRGALPVDESSDDIVFAELVSFMTSWVKLDLMPVELPNSQVERHSNVLSIDASALEVRAALCCWLI